MLLLLLHACTGAKDPPRGDTSTSDTAPVDSQDTGAGTDDSSDPGTDDSSDSGVDTDGDTGGDTGPTFTWGDNLTERGRFEPFSNMEALGLVAVGDGTLVMCAGVARPTAFDVTGDAPVSAAEFGFPAPSTGPRCQHLDATEDARVVVTHHGDEMGAGWVGLADVSDRERPLGVAAWARDGVAPEGVDVDGGEAWVAAHEDGVLRFDLSGGTLGEPDRFAEGVGNAYAVAVADELVAVGLVEGAVELFDRAGLSLGRVEVAGAVRDLAWSGDALYVACGASGIDRVDVSALLVDAHADGPGSAMDLAILEDGSVFAAAYTMLAVYDADLALLGTEEFADEDVAMLAVTTHGGGAWAGEWQTVLSYAWDASLGAPDLRLDRDSVDFPNAEAGEEVAFTLVMRNDGPFDLTISAITPADGVTVDRSTLTIPAGGADYVELRWVSDGMRLQSTLTITSDDPDEGLRTLDVTGNLDRAGVGDPLPSFTYVAYNGTETYSSADLGGPALLSYFATF